MAKKKHKRGYSVDETDILDRLRGIEKIRASDKPLEDPLVPAKGGDVHNGTVLPPPTSQLSPPRATPNVLVPEAESCPGEQPSGPSHCSPEQASPIDAGRTVPNGQPPVPVKEREVDVGRSKTPPARPPPHSPPLSSSGAAPIVVQSSLSETSATGRPLSAESAADVADAHGETETSVSSSVASSATVPPQRCPHVRFVSLNHVRKAQTKWNLRVCQSCAVSAAGGKNANKKKLKMSVARGDVQEPQGGSWVCLTCGFTGCGHDGNDKHSVAHAQSLLRHALAINTVSLQCWCHACERELVIETSVGTTIPHMETVYECREFLRRTAVKKAVVLTVSEAVVPDGPAVTPPVVKGLYNMGNTCFFNAVLQNLSETPPLVEHFVHKDPPMPLGSAKVEGRITSAVRSFLRAMHKSSEPVGGANNDTHPEAKGDKPKLESKADKLLRGAKGDKRDRHLPSKPLTGVIVPKTLFDGIVSKAPIFGGYQQQDSQEVLRYLLDLVCTEEVARIKSEEVELEGAASAAVAAATVAAQGVSGKGIRKAAEKAAAEIVAEAAEERKKAPSVPPPTTVMDATFGGTLCSCVICHECGTVSRVFEPFYDLSLSIPDELKAAESAKMGAKATKLRKKQLKESRRTQNLAKSKIIGLKNAAKAKLHSFASPSPGGDSDREAKESTFRDAVKDNNVPRDSSLKEDVPIEKTPEKADKTDVKLLNKRDKSEVADKATDKPDGHTHPGGTGEHPGGGSKSASEDEVEFENETHDDGWQSSGPTGQASLTETGEALASDDADPPFTCYQPQDPNQSPDAALQCTDLFDAKKMVRRDKGKLRGGKGIVALGMNALLHGFACCTMEEEKSKPDDLPPGHPIEDEHNEPGDESGCFFLGDGQSCHSRTTSIEQRGGDGSHPNFEESTDQDENDDIFVRPASAPPIVQPTTSKDWNSPVLAPAAPSIPDSTVSSLPAGQAIPIKIKGSAPVPSSESVSGYTDLSTSASPGLYSTSASSVPNTDLSFIDDPDVEETERPLPGVPPSSILPRIPSDALSDWSVRSCLYSFIMPEELSGANAFGCGECLKKQKESGALDDVEGTPPVKTMATKFMILEKPPKVLNLHLKRFMQLGRTVKKITRHVSFPLVLDLSFYCSDPAVNWPQSTLKMPNGEESGDAEADITMSTPLLYHLFGVVVHVGGMSGGHYTSFVRKGAVVDKGGFSPTGGEWYHFSDAHRRKVSVEEVLKSEAYMLFYGRC